MDEKYLENIDNLAGNVEDLIAYLEDSEIRRESDVDTASMDTINTDFSTFNQLLNDIKITNTSNNELLNGYLEKLDNIETDTPDEEVLNTDSEFQHFNDNLQEIISMFESLQTTFSNLGINTDLNISSETIDEIKAQLSDGLVVDVDVEKLQEIETLNQTVIGLQESLSGIDTIINGVDFSTWVEDIENVKTSLNSLSEIDLEIDSDVNFDFLDSLSSENIDSIIEKLESLKNIQTDVSIETDFTKLEEVLNSIKELDLSTIEESFNSIDIDMDLSKLEENINSIDIDFSEIQENIKTQLTPILEELNSVSAIEIDLKLKENLSEKMQTLQIEINDFIEQLPPLNINTDINIKTDKDLLIENLENELNDADVNLKPNIDVIGAVEDLNEDDITISLKPELDISGEIERLNSEDNGISLSPEINIDSGEIQNILEGITFLQNQNDIVENEKTDKIIANLEQSNKLLENLSNGILTILNDKEEIKSVTSEDTKVVGKTTSIAKVQPGKDKEGGETQTELLKEISNNIKALIGSNSKMKIEMMKGRFDNDINI